MGAELREDSVVIFTTQLSHPGDLVMVEDAIRKHVRCESGVQCTLLQTMTFIKFKKQCLEALRRWKNDPVCVHLTPELLLRLEHMVCEVRRKAPRVVESVSPPAKRGGARVSDWPGLRKRGRLRAQAPSPQST